MNKIISAFISAFKTFWRTFVVVEDKADDKGYIHIVTPELEVKADFKDEESMRRIQQIIDNEIELRFNRMVELE